MINDFIVNFEYFWKYITQYYHITKSFVILYVLFLMTQSDLLCSLHWKEQNNSIILYGSPKKKKGGFILSL